MKLGTVTKQPAERLSYSVDYSEFLTDGDNVSTVEVAADGVGLTIDEVTVTDPRIKFFVSGGTDSEQYKITIDVVTVDGRILQDEIIMKIKEV